MFIPLYHLYYIIEYSLKMETAIRQNDSIITPRLLDTTLCPFSTTKKSLAHTYNNESIYMASIDKDYEESTIT